MSDAEPAVVNAWSAEDDVLFAHLIVLIDVLQPIEPDEVNHAMTIAEVGHGKLLTLACADFLVGKNLAFQLNKGHIGLQFIDVIDAASVDILIRVVFQELSPRRNAELLLQNLGAPWSHARQIFDVLVEDVQFSSRVESLELMVLALQESVLASAEE